MLVRWLRSEPRCRKPPAGRAVEPVRRRADRVFCESAVCSFPRRRFPITAASVNPRQPSVTTSCSIKRQTRPFSTAGLADCNTTLMVGGPNKNCKLYMSGVVVADLRGLVGRKLFPVSALWQSRCPLPGSLAPRKGTDSSDRVSANRVCDRR